MFRHARNLKFEQAAALRDEIKNWKPVCWVPIWKCLC
ncbi:UvrB/UvrC motif-containing protein [Acidithiobacillus thiooxidans]|nr:UvrB/UvrC motif-containing protein [Acidithiobacillus thiooxidans]